MFGITTAIGIYALAKQWLGRPIGFLCSAIFVSVPSIFHQMPTAQNDISVVCFQFLQLFCLWKWVSERKLAWPALAGAFAGLSLAIKLTALAGCLSGFFTLMLFSGRREVRKSVVAVLLFIGFALTTSVFWYGRSFYYTGSPVYPYFPSLFGGIGRGYDLVKHGVGKGLLDFFLAPVRMTFLPGRFGGLGNQFGPMFLVAIPWLVFLKKDKLMKPISFLLTYVALLFGVWFLGAQNLRFFFSALPALSLLVGITFYLVQQIRYRTLRMIFSGVLGLCLVANTVIAIYYLRHDWNLLLGRESRTEYLTRVERSFGISSYTNQALPAGSKMLSQEIRAFYFKAPVIRYGWKFRATEGFSDLPKEEIFPFLKKRGFTHVLLLKGDLEREEVESSRQDNLSSLLDDHNLTARYFKRVKEMTYVGSNGQQLVYTLLELK
jgi:hypothetical protein